MKPVATTGGCSHSQDKQILDKFYERFQLSEEYDDSKREQILIKNENLDVQIFTLWEFIDF